MSNLKSSQIDIFPTSIQRSLHPGARNLSESNILKLLKGYSDKESFVISDEYIQGKSFEFLIGGYYCKITPDNAQEFPIKIDGLSDVPNIYAIIEIINETEPSYPILYGDDIINDETSYFTGVHFLTDPNNYIPKKKGVVKTLHLATRIDGDNLTYEIPKESLEKIKTKSLNLIVDGGDI